MTTILARSVVAVAVMMGAVAQAGVKKETEGDAEFIAGVYLLYSMRDPAKERPVTKMAITARGAKSFSIKGLDQPWSGEGRIDEENEGFYNWVFVDGKSGRTTFTINADGTLTGTVRGKGVDTWTYLARRVKE